MMNVPFNLPYVGERTATYIGQALRSRKHAGNWGFGQRCIELLKERYGLGEVFLVPSATAALEMGALLADVGPGDEVILPSYTFSSTANAIVLRGARPVFCEVEEATLNVDVADIERRITPRTRMILPIDYAGHSCRIGELRELCDDRGIVLMLDAAQSLHSKSGKNWTGAEADLTAFSFHETKNISCGEGGALVVNRPDWIERAAFAQEKGTDRSLVLRGARERYQWVCAGSSYLLAEPLAAMLLAQLEDASAITESRAAVTSAYAQVFAPYQRRGLLHVIDQPAGTTWNHHAFVVVFDTEGHQVEFLRRMKEKGISAYIGYMPLHASPMGHSLGYRSRDLPRTASLGARIVRMPLYNELRGDALAYVVETTAAVLEGVYSQSNRLPSRPAWKAPALASMPYSALSPSERAAFFGPPAPQPDA